MSYTLRDLPLPVKVVASVFLMAVGLGYGSAMVQLHVQDSKSGKPMPSVDDVIKKFTGKVKYDPAKLPPAPVSRLEALVMGPENVAICGQTMAPAFTTEDRGPKELNFHHATKGKSEKEVEAIRAERRGEQRAFQLWINAPEEQRKKAYEENRLELPADQMPAALTPSLKDGGAVKVKSIIQHRCENCHSKGGEKEDVPLTTYDELAKFMAVQKSAPVVNGYVKVEEPVSIAKLTQSTHAHLLSFAMLFSLTGLIFAFSSYPVALRCVLGPWVVVAVFADVSLWWLARLSDEWGPFFAMGVVGTGGAAGLGVAAQIVLSLFNMYGTKGKLVLALLFALGGVLGGLVWVNKIQPELDRKAQELCQADKGDKGKATGTAKGGGNVNVQTGNGKTENGGPKKAENSPPHKPINDLDRLLTLPVLGEDGKPLPADQVKFNGREHGSMVPAFFEKDKSKVYPKAMADAAVPQAKKDELKEQRQAELDAVVAWVRSPEGVRKLAYETDGFAAPLAAGKLAPEFVKDGRAKVKSIIDARCAACHNPDGAQADYPLTSYEELSSYLKPFVPEAPAAPAPRPQPSAPAKPAATIPAAKDD